MPVEIRIACEDAEVKTLLGVIGRRTKNLTPAMKLIGEVAHGSILKNFQEGGRPAWEDLSKVTKALRAKKKKWPGQILIRRGVAGGLMGAISYRAESDRVILSAKKKHAAVQHFGAEKGEFGTIQVSVAAFFRKRTKKRKRHQVKAHTRKMLIPWGDIPARPYMMLQRGDWPRMRATLLDYLLRGNRRR